MVFAFFFKVIKHALPKSKSATAVLLLPPESVVCDLCWVCALLLRSEEEAAEAEEEAAEEADLLLVALLITAATSILLHPKPYLGNCS